MTKSFLKLRLLIYLKKRHAVKMLQCKMLNGFNKEENVAFMVYSERSKVQQDKVHVWKQDFYRVPNPHYIRPMDGTWPGGTSLRFPCTFLDDPSMQITATCVFVLVLFFLAQICHNVTVGLIQNIKEWNIDWCGCAQRCSSTCGLTEWSLSSPEALTALLLYSLTLNDSVTFLFVSLLKMLAYVSRPSLCYTCLFFQ